MAQSKGKKKTGAAKSSARSKKAAETRQKQLREAKLRRDIRVLVVLLICVLVFLSVLGIGGVAGKAVGALFFGLFGIPAYVFPFLFFYLFLFITANEMSREAISRVIGLGGIYVALCVFFQVILMGYKADLPVANLYLESAVDKSGGGLLGGIFVQLFGALFGTPGVYVITIAALILFSILLTQKPLLSVIRERGEYAYDTRGERREARDQKRLLRIERNEALRADREREKLLRERRRQRQAEAKERAVIARQVIPQTITSDTGVTNVSGKGIRPITAGPLEGVEDRIEVAPEELTAERSTRAQKKAEPIPVPVEEVRISPDDIPDDIISNSAADLDDTVFTAEEPSGQMVITDDEEDAEAIAKQTEKQARSSARPKTDSEAMPEAENAEQSEQKYARKGRPSVGEPEKLEIPEQEEEVNYVEPPLELLDGPKGGQNGDSNSYLKETAAKLKETLHTFGVEVTINHISCGPTVTRYELTPQMGVKVSKILGLQDDIKLNLAAADIRIEAPIPGKAAIGIEVPNKSKSSVNLRELMSTENFRNHKSRLAFCVGKDIAGQAVIADIAKMPHLLIAGATGSGKSVFINTLIMSLIYKSRPDEVKFIMIDPKVVELSVYNGIPHMLIPVVTDPKKAAGALNWAVSEMTDRYQKFAEMGVRDLNGYNAKLDTLPEPEEGSKPKKMYRLVVIVDELADLMMVAQNEVEDSICRLAQLARAAGIHLVIATQRPSVNVITGLIKANMPSRVALSVTSGVDSRTIIDMNGAEKLLGNGDMLFYPQGYQKPARVQGAYLSDDEIARVAKFLKEQHQGHFHTSNEIQSQIESHSLSSVSPSGDVMDNDEYFTDAAKMIIEKDKASIGMLQRAFRIGFNRAARIMDQLYDAGVVGAEEGTKPRKILMTMEQLDNYLEEH